jgi:hypothetical protein
MENTHAHVIAGASSGLQRAAIGLGTEVIALLHAAGSQVEVTYFWRRSRDDGPERRRVKSNRLLDDVVHNTAAEGTSVVSVDGSRLAAHLRDTISERSKSFLLFPSRGGQEGTAGVIGFTESRPPVSEVPDAVAENLNLLGWATWCANEIARLRGELRIVNERLAGRKLVERAKSALQAEQNVSEEQAYEYLRSLSRKRRITLAALSAEVLGGRAGRNPAQSQSTA